MVPSSQAIQAIEGRLRGGPTGRPVLVGLDGRSGVGKSTLAARLGAALGATVIEGDAFFAGGVSLHDGTPQTRADLCIDRPRLFQVLTELRGGQAARFRPFDWEAFDGRLLPAVQWPPAAYVVVEGVYACHPDFHDLLDLRLLAVVDPPLREERLREREATIGPWERQWHEAEDWYFSALMPPGRFDLVVDTGR